MQKSQTSRARTFFAPLIAVIMLALSLVFVSGSTPAVANPDPNQVCAESGAGWTTKVDTTGDPAMVTVTADPGMLIDAYCVSGGPVRALVTQVVPPAASVNIVTGQVYAVSHYQYRQIPKPVVADLKDSSFTQSVVAADCDSAATLTYSGSNVIFSGPASPVSGPATGVVVTATPTVGHDWSSDPNDDAARTVFSGNLAGPTGFQSTNPNAPCYEPPAEEPEKKVVVCKYTGTPPGGLSHIIIVDENTLNNVVGTNGLPYVPGQFPFSWTDAQGQTQGGSVAIRYATENEQAKNVLLAECPGEEEPPPVDVCPNIDGNQVTVPEGMVKDANGNCVTPPPPPPVDVCPNIDGNQPPGTDCNPRPAPEVVEESVSGCDLSVYGLAPGEWMRTGVQEYVLVGGSWVLEPPADIAWNAWTGEAWSQDEFIDECVEVKPSPQVRTTTTTRESCELGGVETTTSYYTTEWVLDGTEWVLGPEVLTETEVDLEEYTRGELKTLGCVDNPEEPEEPEVAGEQAQVINHQLPEVEVKGEQAVAPSVPTAVDAGLGTEESPLGSGRNPLWLLAVGGGLGLIGSAGLRRRVTANR